jgi:formylglycine-generating enzyme required for sulfatase activity
MTVTAAMATCLSSAEQATAQADKQLSNSIGMKMVLIPAGTFQMGTRLTPEQVHQRYPGGKVQYYEGETQHQVKLTKPFYIGVHEVTVDQFRKFVEAEGYKTEAERDGEGGYGFDTETKERFQDSKYSWRNPGFEQDDKHPVVNVSWNDAVAFCRWLSRVEGLEYRLPTEAEWEYSCRAGSSREYTFGDDAEQLVGFSNVADASLKTTFPNATTVQSNDGSIFTTRVGSYRSNEFGLYDMHGNVLEWCSDWYGAYPTSSVVDPVGPVTGSDRVHRGGCWCRVAAGCRSARRSSLAPDYRDFALGFRLALSSSGIPQSPEADK